MPTRLRHLALTAHVVASVGWLGAVITFLALALVGLAATDPEKARACYVAMDVVTSTVILPLAVASILTGLLQSLCTRWGLFRHYWVVAKLVIALISTALLVLHMRPITIAAQAAATHQLFAPAMDRVRDQLVLDAALAIVALLAATVLSIYKPVGMTAYGRRVEGRNGALGAGSLGFYILVGIVLLLAAAVGVHLAGGGLHAH